jgi:tetratricopeptide (TPR) repeat protein
MSTCEDRYNQIQEIIVQQRYDEAIVELERLVAKHGDYAPAYFDLGNLYYISGQLDRALTSYEKSVELEPESPLYLKNLADLLYSERKDTDRALTLYNSILSLRPDDVQALMVTGHLCVTLEHFEKALEYYNRVLDIEPWNEEAQQFVDQIRLRTDKVDENMDPEEFYRRCHELINSGNTDAAFAYLETLIAKHPDFSLAHNDLGVLYFQRGDKERCLKCYQKAVELQPENTNFRKNLADFYLVENKDVEKALKIYLSILNDDPEDIDVLMVAGHICKALGKMDSARVFYERVMDVEPWNMEAEEALEKLSENS